LNSKIDLVTQSVTSATTIDIDGKGKGMALKEAGTGAGSQKIDMEKWTARIEQSVSMTVSVGPMPAMALKSEVRMIVDASKKLVVVWEEVSNATSGKVMKHNCSAMTIAKMPPPAELTMLWNTMKPMVQKFAKCGGNDGTYDTWNVDFEHKSGTPWPMNIPGLPENIDLSLNLELKMDKDYLLHSETAKASFQTEDIKGSGPISATEKSTTSVSGASNAGPTDADLDYSTWGTCTAINPPAEQALQFLSDLQGLKKDGKSSMQNLLFLTLQASLASPSTEVVV